VAALAAMDLSAFTLEALLPFITIGFAAQMADGALGMAFTQGHAYRA
jgi:hypothetical protein